MYLHSHQSLELSHQPEFHVQWMGHILILDIITWTRLVWVGTAGKVTRDGLEGGGGGGAVGMN